MLAVPNVSEGRDEDVLEEIASAFISAGATLLDRHSDPDHHRSVFTLAGERGELAHALLAGFCVAIDRIDIADGRGQHPHVGAVDVAPIVHVDRGSRGAAAAEALLLADLLGERLDLPVLLYGELAGGRARAQLRAGGPATLDRRIASGEIVPDFGPRSLHPTAGATLVASRPPLVAFNLELSRPAGVEEARQVAKAVREGGRRGLRGLRAIGISLLRPDGPPVGQVSMNVEDPGTLRLRDVVEAVRAEVRALSGEAVDVAGGEPVDVASGEPVDVASGEAVDVASREAVKVASGELVGLAPAAAFEGFPEDLPMPAFDPSRQIIENALGL